LKNSLKSFRSAFLRIAVIRMLRFMRLRSLKPISRQFGMDRGKPIDRYYIEAFLQKYSQDIQQRVLEIGSAKYSRMFGKEQITHQDVLHAIPGNPNATLVGDLATGDGILSENFDCMLLTQTLHVIYDMKSAIANVHRSLTPGGVALVTLPGISQISRYDMERWGDYWRFTSLSAEKLFGEVFGEANVDVTLYGNVLSATAFLYGIAAEEFKKEELIYSDPDYQVLICVRAKKEHRQA